jgi:HD-GYP domain-containing protein (c-di-GMP phosphodiesterase class II)
MSTPHPFNDGAMLETGATAAELADRERRRKTAAFARDFLSHFGAVMRQLAVHDRSNRAVLGVAEEIIRSIQTSLGQGESVSLVFVEGHTFVNGVWVRAVRASWDGAVQITAALNRRGARGLVIQPSVSPSDLLTLALVLRSKPSMTIDPLEETRAQVPAGIELIEQKPPVANEVTEQQKHREEATQILNEGLMIISPNELVRLDLYMRRRQRALVMRLVQAVEEHPESLLALTTVRDARLRAATHSLMVCMFALTMGRAMALDRRDLLRLGTAALNHNLGEIFIPKGVKDSPRRLNDAEAWQVQSHAPLGMAHILKHYGYSPGMIDRALVALEHHIHFDGKGGYPLPIDGQGHLFSRMIAVADVYNALCSDRPHRPGYPPDQAVKLLRREAGTKLDPVMVRTFTRMVGRYPPGSMVELDTGEIAVVAGPGKGADPLRRPRVVLITDAEGNEMTELLCVDLGDRHQRRRAWLRTIMRTRDPGRTNIEVSRFLLADRIEVTPDRLDKDEFQNRPLPAALPQFGHQQNPDASLYAEPRTSRPRDGA